MPEQHAGEILTSAGLEDLGGPITAFTPTLTAATDDPDLGTGGTAALTWSRQGDLVVGRFHIQFGTSGVDEGFGRYFVDLPVPAEPGGLSRLVLGAGWIRDDSDSSSSGTKLIVLDLALDEDPTGGLMRPAVEGNRFVSDATPWTWNTSDELMGEFAYPGDFT
ncbi:MAG: hypothetical protein ACLFXM_16140 [Acidimicrobiia bacterium]